MKDKKIVKTLVDTETGEYLELHEGDSLKIISQKQDEAIEASKKTKKLNKDMDKWNKSLGGFVFVLFKYCDDVMKQQKEITSEDITKLFYLATYVDYEGYLIYEDGYMSRNEMNEVLGIHISAFDLFFNKMKSLGILIQDKNKNIKINKEYFSKGEIEKEIKQYYAYTRVYIKTIRFLFKNVPKRQHKQLGNYFKIIPYIHRQQNVLCWNPDSMRDDLNLMHVKDLKTILGYTTDKGVKGFIKELLSVRLDNGEAILGFFRTEYDEGKSYIIVNPKVFFGGRFESEESKNAIMKWFSK